MSKYKNLRVEILNILQDKEEHTVDDIKQSCEEKGFDFQNKKDPIYNMVHQLKKKGVIISPRKGVYQINDDNKQEGDGDYIDVEFQNCIKKIEEEIERYRKFSWVNCSEREWKIASIKGKQMMRLAEKLEEIKGIFF